MSHEVISYMLQCTDPKKRLQFHLVLQCAPFLKGLKAACVINLETALCQELAGTFKNTDISYALLTQGKRSCLVLFYRKIELAEYLMVKEVRMFLLEYGYSSFGVEEVLSRLKDNLSVYLGNEAEFPHEMGVILGYPVTDVIGFIENSGQNYLFSGYWKVYSDLGKAQMTFGMYDYARTCAVNEFVAGKPIERIVCA